MLRPSAAAAAYQAIAANRHCRLRAAAAAASRRSRLPRPAISRDFLTEAVKDGIGTMKPGRDDGRRARSPAKANIVDVVNAVNSAEITLDTVVAVRDKVVAGLSVHHEHADLSSAEVAIIKERDMKPADSIDFARSSILVLLEIITPAMLTALVVGLGIGLLQALTQIQEMTLVFVPKIVAIFVVLLIALPFAGAAMSGLMTDIAQRIAAY